MSRIGHRRIHLLNLHLQPLLAPLFYRLRFLAKRCKFSSVFQTVIPNYDREDEDSRGQTAQHHDKPSWHLAVTLPLVFLLVGNDKVLLVVDDVSRGTLVLDEAQCNYVLIADAVFALGKGLRSGGHSLNVPEEPKQVNFIRKVVSVLSHLEV